eukprot:3659535-Rhodomonas_salina.2
MEEDSRIQAGDGWITASSDFDSNASDASFEQELADMGLVESNIKENKPLPEPSAEAGPPSGPGLGILTEMQTATADGSTRVDLDARTTATAPTRRSHSGAGKSNPSTK